MTHYFIPSFITHGQASNLYICGFLNISSTLLSEMLSHVSTENIGALRYEFPHVLFFLKFQIVFNSYLNFLLFPFSQRKRTSTLSPSLSLLFKNVLKFI